MEVGVIHRLASWLRKVVDDDPAPTPILLVAFLGGMALALGWQVEAQAWKGCDAPVFSLVDLELTFNLGRFRALLDSVPIACRPGVIRHFVTWDIAFPMVYPFALSALYLWIERCRRWLPRKPNERKAVAITSPRLDAVNDWLVVLPFVAGLLDLLGENVWLYLAARAWPSPTFAASFVVIGSVGAALKFTCLAMFGIGCVGMIFSGPRGVVLWRVRASVFGALFAGVPLLIIPQGQDILRRLVEGERPMLRVATAVIVIALTALVTWYAARTLTLVRDGDVYDPWYAFFERHIPRIVAVALLSLSALAFAREGRAELVFAGVATASYLATVAITRWRKPWLGAIGRIVIPSTEARRDDLLPEHLGRVLIGMGSVLVFWAWSKATMSPGESEDHVLRTGAALLLAATWLLHFVVYFRRDIGALRKKRTAEELRGLRDRWSTEFDECFPLGQLPLVVRREVLLAGFVSLLLFVLFTFRTVWAARLLGPLIVLAAVTANAVVMGSALAYLGRRYRLPFVVIAVALAAVFSMWNDNHAVRTLPAPSVTTPMVRSSLDAYLASWLRARAARDTTDTTRIPLVLVGVAGGGLRAAYWTAVSLATLQDRDTSFASHTFAISGVSGGSVGAAVFAAMRHDLNTAPSDCRERLLRKGGARTVAADSASVQAMGPASACARVFMADDFLSPVLAKFLAPDFTQWFLPIPIHRFDRGLALEETFERSYADAMHDTTWQRGMQAFSGLDAVTRGVPLLLLNTTHVETGRRYITSPFADTAIFLDAVDMQRAFGGVDVRLSTAVHNSARFTYVSPAGRIDRVDGKTYGGLVDGGYFENSGLATVNELRRALSDRLERIQDPGLARLARRVHIAVVYLCNDPLSCLRERQADTSLIASSGAVGEWLAPVRALAATRDARGRLARATTALEVARRQGAGQAGSFYQLNVCESLRLPAAAAPESTVVEKTARERIVNPPLGWLMSGRARRWMDSSLVFAGTPVPGNCRAANARAMDALVALLRHQR